MNQILKVTRVLVWSIMVHIPVEKWAMIQQRNARQFTVLGISLVNNYYVANVTHVTDIYLRHAMFQVRLNQTHQPDMYN